MALLVKALLFVVSVCVCNVPLILLIMLYARSVKKRRLAQRQAAIDEGRQVVGHLIAKKSRKAGMPADKGRHLARYQYTGTDGTEYTRWYSLLALPPKELTLYLKKGREGTAYTEAQVVNFKSGGILFMLLFLPTAFVCAWLYQFLCAQFIA